MASSPDHGQRGIADRLPDVRGPRAPSGYRPGLQLGERLQGLGLVLLGLIGLVGSLLLLQPAGPVAAALHLPTLAASLTCLGPILAIGAVGLVVAGLGRAIRP